MRVIDWHANVVKISCNMINEEQHFHDENRAVLLFLKLYLG